MSKSKNTIDPEQMIEKYGADAVDYLFFLIALQKIFSVRKWNVIIIQIHPKILGNEFRNN